MTPGNSTLEPIQGSGWSRGLGNHLKGELERWFGSRKWWTQMLVFALLINGFLLLMLASSSGEFDLKDGVGFLNGMLGVIGAIGGVILVQGALVGEKRSGTAAWVLSKPISRPAFFLAKLIANAIGTLVTITLAQGLIGYLVITFEFDTAPALPAFLVGLAPQILHMLFYLTLALMLGAMFDRRGPVLAIPIIPLLFVDELLPAVASPALLDVLQEILPVGLATGYENAAPSIAGSLMLGDQPYSLGPIFWTMVFSALFVAIGLWFLGRQEF
jgi:ABC-2 type transport system permease protein